MTVLAIIKQAFNRPTTAYPLTQSLDILPRFVRQSPVAHWYHRLLSRINWDAFPERELHPQGRHTPTPYRPFVAACLVKLDQHKQSMAQLHTYLLEHPALMHLLGFPAKKILPQHSPLPDTLPLATHHAQCRLSILTR